MSFNKHDLFRYFERVYAFQNEICSLNRGFLLSLCTLNRASAVQCTTMNDTSSNVRKGPNKLTSWGHTKNFEDMNSTLKPYQGRSALANWCNGAGGELLLGTPGLRPMRGPRSPSRTRRSWAWEWAWGHRMRSLSGWWSSFCHHPLPLPWIGQSRQKCQMPSSNAGLDLIKRLKCI